MTTNYEIPKKISAYIRRLEIMYRKPEDALLHEIVSKASILVREGVAYDNWNGGIDGHAIEFQLTEDLFEIIGDFRNQRLLEERLWNDLRECSRSIEGEFISSVVLMLLENKNLENKNAVTPFSSKPDPDSLNIWKSGYIRLFISHRDEYKKQASELAKVLEEYGISAFVAHDTIEPMEEWQHVIRKALITMEIMLAFITDDFFDSYWTNQELGVAIGQNTPIIPLKLQKTDPKGFISSIQAVLGQLDNPQASIEMLYKVLAEKLKQEERLAKAIIQVFINAKSWDDAKRCFNRLVKIKTISELDAQKIINGFSINKQLYDSLYLTNHHNRLVNFLEEKTGKKYQIFENKIIEIKSELLDDKVPF